MSINDHPTDTPVTTSHDAELEAWRSRHDLPVEPPAPTDRAGPTTALTCAVASLVTPIVMWVVVNALHTVSSDAVGGLVLLLFLSCGAALIGFVMGIIGRGDGRGALAIGVSILGGLISVGSLFAMSLAMAFAGMSAGL